MVRKLTMLGMAIAAFAAFVVPAVASASPVMKSGATTVPAETEITGKSSNAVTTGTPLGTLTCEEVHILGEVTENTGTSATGVGLEEGNSTKGCKAGGLDLTVTSPTLVELHTDSGTTDEGFVALTFIADVGPVECHYTGSGTFDFTTGSDLLQLVNIPLHATSELCESEPANNIKFSGDFTLTTASNGAPVSIN